MVSLTQSKRVSTVCDAIRSKDIGFEITEVYLFGSFISREYPNDIDILIVYRNSASNINTVIDELAIELETITNLPVDFTLLSENEMAETLFLNKLSTNYLRII